MKDRREHYKERAKNYQLARTDEATHTVVLTSEDRHCQDVTITAIGHGRVLVHDMGSVGMVRRTSGNGIGLIAECGELIEHPGYGAEKYDLARGAKSKEWDEDGCREDLLALIEEEKEEEWINEDKITAWKEICEQMNLGCDNQHEYWELCREHVDYEDPAFNCGMRMTENCLWTLAMLWRASALIIAADGEDEYVVDEEILRELTLAEWAGIVEEEEG